MVNTFTLNQFVRFIYQECSSEEAQIIKEEIRENWDSREEYQTLVEAKNMLPKVLFGASNKSMLKVLNYSR